MKFYERFVSLLLLLGISSKAFGQHPSYDKSNFFLMYTLGFTIIGREKG